MNLAAMPLEVAEACSGIRSLMSLVTLAIIYGYFMERRLWVRWLLALAAYPSPSSPTMSASSAPDCWSSTGIPPVAEGYFHASWGWMIFVVSLPMLYAMHALVRFLLPEKDGGA